MIKYLENKMRIEIIDELRTSVGWKLFTPQQSQHAIEMSEYSLVAFCDDKPVGMGRIIGDGIYYLICDVIVKPEYQGQGIGKYIMKGIIENVKNHLQENQRCTIQLISAQGKEKFYKKLGFVALPSEDSGHGMRLLITKED